MLSALEIKNVKFSKSMGGYKQEEVDILLDKIEADIGQYERLVKDLQAKNEALTSEINELKASQSSIQSVLLSAQQLADRIVSEAKEKSEEIIKSAETNISVITAHEKELSATFELKAQERKAELEKELSDMVKKAQLKADSITAAADDSVARQQMLFDKLKIEIAAFKTAVTGKYKEHLAVLSALPDTVPSDPKSLAEIVSAEIDKAPEPARFIKAPAQEDNIKSASEVKEEDNFGFFINEASTPLEEEVFE